MDLNHYQRKMIKSWLTGIFAFSLGQVFGFLHNGSPTYAVKYFGDYAPWHLAIHISGFAVVFWGLFIVVGKLADRRDRKKCANSQS